MSVEQGFSHQDPALTSQPAATSPQGPVAAPVDPAPEQTFFTDPALDRLYGVMLNLATEVFVLRERCAAMQDQLERSGALDAGLMQAEPTPDEAAARVATQQAFVDHLLEPLLGVQATRGAQDTQKAEHQHQERTQ